MRDLLEAFKKLRGYEELRRKLEGGSRSIWAHSLYGSARSFLIASLIEEIGAPLLVITPSQDDAEKMASDLFELGVDVRVFPEWSSHVHIDLPPPKEVVADRISALKALIKGEGCVVICPVASAMRRTIPPQVMRDHLISLKVGDEIPMVRLLEMLERCGYERKPMVELKGEFSVRGGIVDVYPPIRERPVRIEFFGDEIDSMREFDPATQRSVGKISSVDIPPVTELVITPEAVESWGRRFREIYAGETDRRVREKLLEIDMQVREAGDQRGLEPYLPLFYPDASTVLDYLGEEGLLIVDEPVWVEREARRFLDRLREVYRKRGELGHFAVDPDESFEDYSSLRAKMEGRRKICLSLAHRPDEVESVEFDTGSLGIRGNVRLFLEELRSKQEEGYRAVILCESEVQMRRVEGVVEAYRLDPEMTSIRVGRISDGFILNELKLVLISDAEIFSRRPHRRARPRRVREGLPIPSFSELREGDYVVHVSHGIGIYEGLRRVKVEGHEQEFLVIRYADGDLLYVPTYQLDLVQKYIGASDEARVRIDKLGGATWSKVKQRVKRSVQQLAKELLELYAARQVIKGHAFSEDTPWQKEFEALFPYEETPDQLRAIEEVKRDMEKPRPMDRLICGDVGYGKTEVAMRAAFKAVMDGKQVAVLVPTTVLAQQHYMTFSERFADFPVVIEMLSRFQTPKKRREILEGLAKGTVDIVIGTHMLLQENVKFKDLGLVIIDEEHRFGVRHKEKLKQLRREVDVLTMTATPIPRTLYMAISGILDMSVIETPPENRQPIETYVMEYNPQVVREAILRELERGGQVFYVHNRVETIASAAANLQRLVPEARIAVAHGQMSERLLEKVMLDFINRKYDVLVCTTIIESGIDIPNVNTIIIDRADTLGLAQLYQLRGRVGRAGEKAYGYLFYPKDRAITEGAQKRLKVIEELTELGSGFKLALSDLEIRGAGNILGPEQHGHINAVGYELYCKLLEEAVRELKGEKVEEEVETRISLPIDAYIPDDYIPDPAQKVMIYKKIASARDEGWLRDIEEELRDRFGELPEQVRALLEIASLKLFARKLGVESISSDGETVRIAFLEGKAKVDPMKLVELVQRDRSISIIPPARISIKLSSERGTEICGRVREVLEGIKEG